MEAPTSVSEYDQPVGDYPLCSSAIFSRYPIVEIARHRDLKIWKNSHAKLSDISCHYNPTKFWLQNTKISRVMAVSKCDPMMHVLTRRATWVQPS